MTNSNSPRTETWNLSAQEIETYFGGWDVDDVDFNGRRVFETTNYDDDGRPYFSRAVVFLSLGGPHFAAVERTDFPPR
jgi:hypothetical protein